MLQPPDCVPAIQPIPDILHESYLVFTSNLPLHRIIRPLATHRRFIRITKLARSVKNNFCIFRRIFNYFFVKAYQIIFAPISCVFSTRSYTSGNLFCGSPVSFLLKFFPLFFASAKKSSKRNSPKGCFPLESLGGNLSTREKPYPPSGTRFSFRLIPINASARKNCQPRCLTGLLRSSCIDVRANHKTTTSLLHRGKPAVITTERI